jgi:hypothetical protein
LIFTNIKTLITDVSRPGVAANAAHCEDAEAHESHHTHKEGLASCFRLEERCRGEDVETHHGVEVEAEIVAASMEYTQAAY